MSESQFFFFFLNSQKADVECIRKTKRGIDLITPYFECIRTETTWECTSTNFIWFCCRELFHLHFSAMPFSHLSLLQPTGDPGQGLRAFPQRVGLTCSTPTNSHTWTKLGCAMCPLVQTASNQQSAACVMEKPCWEGRDSQTSWLKHEACPHCQQHYPLEILQSMAFCWLGKCFCLGPFFVEAMFACKPPLTATRGSQADVHTSVNLQQEAETAGDVPALQPVSAVSSLIFYWSPLLRGELKIHSTPLGKCLFWLQRMVPNHGKIKTSK